MQAALALSNARLNIIESCSGPETLVLLHGRPLSQRMFDEQVEALDSRLRWVRMDFRGPGDCGLSLVTIERSRSNVAAT